MMVHTHVGFQLLGKLRQEDCKFKQFKAILGNLARSQLKI